MEEKEKSLEEIRDSCIGRIPVARFWLNNKA